MSEIIINNEECRQIVGFRSWRTKGRVFINEVKIHFRVHNGKLRQGFASLTDSEGKLHNVAVAPLVAVAFGVLLVKWNKKKQAIDYKDGNKRNLHYSNLMIVEKIHVNSKLNRKDILHIKKQIKLGMPLRKIAYVFGVSEMQINRIKTGENWGNGKRKIKVPVAPFEIKDGRIRKYIATFDKKKTVVKIKKPFTLKRNSSNPTDNLIVGIVNGYKLSLKHTNVTRAKRIVEKLNKYFFI